MVECEEIILLTPIKLIRLYGCLTDKLIRLYGCLTDN